MVYDDDKQDTTRHWPHSIKASNKQATQNFQDGWAFGLFALILPMQPARGYMRWVRMSCLGCDWRFDTLCRNGVDAHRGVVVAPLTGR